ncbi:MAG: STAS domain-containing protein [Bryobacteraceae bacterium]
MPLSIEKRVEQNVTVLQLSGPLTLGPSLHALNQAARKTLESAATQALILDVGGVTIVDSAGLGELTLVYTLATRRNCRVVLACVTPMLRHSLDVTHLDGLLPACSDVNAAKKFLASPKEI